MTKVVIKNSSELTKATKEIFESDVVIAIDEKRKWFFFKTKTYSIFKCRWLDAERAKNLTKQQMLEFISHCESR